MKNYIPKTLVLLTLAIMAAVFLSARQPLGEASTQRPVKPELRKVLSRHSSLPLVTQFGQAQAATAQDQERRQSRQRVSQGLYAGRLIMDPGVRDINGQSETLDLKFIDGVKILKPGERKDPDGLPISGNTIVIGTVVSGDAYVSQNNDGVFSEYKVAVTEVLKSDPATVISAQDEITTWRPGGSVQFQSGHVKHFVIAGRGFPEVGTQYVFFLRRADKDVKDYAIASAYSIKDQIVSTLDDGQDQGSFDGMSLTEFLDKLRQEISARQEGGMQQ